MVVTILKGNIRPQSSQLAEPLRTDPGMNSGTVELVQAKKKKKKKRKREMNGRTFSKILAGEVNASFKRYKGPLSDCHYVDSRLPSAWGKMAVNAQSTSQVISGRRTDWTVAWPVSYTHLTLPTKLSV